LLVVQEAHLHKMLDQSSIISRKYIRTGRSSIIQENKTRRSCWYLFICQQVLK